jgi:hypothetical protein
MPPLPATDLRSNLATWAVPVQLLPAVGNWMHDVLPNESYDPHFRGQKLETTYFDTQAFALRRARVAGERYLTLRIRCYDSEGEKTYALSAKTELEKWRQEISPAAASHLIELSSSLQPFLPPHLAARLTELTGDVDPLPVVTICCRRFAVEDETSRYTLDTDVSTDTGKRLPFGVLELKATSRAPDLPVALPGLYPLKLSKFLWSTKP